MWNRNYVLSECGMTTYTGPNCRSLYIYSLFYTYINALKTFGTRIQFTEASMHSVASLETWLFVLFTLYLSFGGIQTAYTILFSFTNHARKVSESKCFLYWNFSSWFFVLQNKKPSPRSSMSCLFSLLKNAIFSLAQNF